MIDTSHLMETLPVVWELLLDEDQQLVSSAGKPLNKRQRYLRTDVKFRILTKLFRKGPSRK